jgi:ATP-binding cassette subfamily F protein 3
MGEEEVDEGVVRWGANLSIGYYDQRLDEFDPERQVIEELSEGRVANDKQLRDALALMLFRGDDVYKPMGLLSGGERARVRLAQLLMDKPNVLVMDEPTNHLDIASREALEGALAGFPGTILCVSHDRYFLDRAIARMWIVRDGGVKDFDGNYSAWVKKTASDRVQASASASRAADQEKQRAKNAAATSAARPAPKKDNPYKRPFGRLSTEQLEKEVQSTEAGILRCQASFGDPELAKDVNRAKALHQEYESLRLKLRQLEEEYFARG